MDSRSSKLTVWLCTLLVTAGCGDDDEPGGGTGPSSNSETVVASAELQRPPSVDFDASTGTTQVTVDFVARNASGRAIAPDSLELSILINGAPIDNEALLDEGSEELATDLALWPTLDASFSMTQHDPPAFRPMLQQARRTVQSGANLYASRPGDFEWNLIWFNRYLHVPTNYGWTPNTIEGISSPEPGAFTKLFAAVAYQARASLDAWTAGGMNPREEHLLVVFSDGADTYSHFDNSETNVFVAGNGAHNRIGYTATTKADALQALESHANLRVHVIGMGSDVNVQDLRDIANSGNGRYFAGNADEIESLFSEVINEFTTVQTRGVVFPWPAGVYQFELRFSPSTGSADSRIRFQFRAGDDDAGVVN